MYDNKPEFPGGRGMQNNKPSVGGVWILSGTAQSFNKNFQIFKLPENLLLKQQGSQNWQPY